MHKVGKEKDIISIVHIHTKIYSYLGTCENKFFLAKKVFFCKVLQPSASKYLFHHENVICPSNFMNEIK